MHSVRPRLRLVLVAALAGAAVAFLVAARPSPAVSSFARGDDLAVAASWAVALVASAWLLAGSVACLVALGTRRPHLARSLARALPPVVRRAVDVAIVASCLAVSAAPAHAANTGTGLVVDQPVVRAPSAEPVPPVSLRPPLPRPNPRRTPPPAPPRATSAPVSRRAAPPTTTTAGAPRRAAATAPTNAEPRARAAHASPSVRPAAPPATARSVFVRPGDNLWRIARAEFIGRSDAHPRDDAIVRYWRLVIDANRPTLRSGNPSLIFPGELVTLPPVPDVS